MKTKSTFRSFLLRPACLAMTVTLSVLAAGQAAAQTWTGATDALWDTDTNWSDTPPASDDSSALIFNPANLTGSAILATSNDLTNFTANGISFDNSTIAGAFTLAGNQIILGGNITTTGATGTPTHVISLDTILSGNRTISTELDNNLSISGIIDQDSPGRSLTKAGAGLLTLSAANSYSGGTNINEGTIQVDTGGTLGDTSGALKTGTGSVGVLGTVGNLTLNTAATVGAINIKSNTSDTTTPANIGQLSIASGKTLTASSFNAGLTSNGTDNVNTASAISGAGTLTVNGNMVVGLAGGSTAGLSTTVVDLSGLNTFNLTSTGGSLSVGSAENSKGILTLANAENNINVGTFSVGVLTTTANYNLAKDSEVKLGAGTNTIWTTNLFLGRGKASGRLTFADSAGSVIIAGLDGIGAVTTVNIGNNNVGSSWQGTESRLLLAGHNATVSATNVVVGATTQGSAKSTVKGLLTFDTGTFTSSNLQIAVGSAGNGNSANGSVVVGGATANSAATGVMNISGNILLADVDDNDVTGTGTLTINGGTVNVNTGAVATQGIRDNSSKTGGGNTTLTLQGGTLDLNGGIIGGDNASGNRTIDNLNFRSGTLKNVGQINNGTTGLTKTSDGTESGGTLILDGPNTYTGNTVVSEGTLELAATGQLKFVLGATSGDNNSLSGDGTATLNGSFVIDTSAADALASGTWTLEDVTTLTGPYGTTFSVVGFDDIGSDQWEKSLGGGKKYTFDETTGILTLSGGSSNTFANWISDIAFGIAPADQGLNADPDGDGISNGVENFFGTNPGTFSQGLVAGTQSGSTFTFTHPQSATPASDLTASYTWSKDLATFLADGATDGAATKVDFTTQADTPTPGTTTVTATVTGTATSKLFVRVDVTQP